MMKYGFVYLFVILLAVSCSDGDDVDDVAPLLDDVVLPQGGNADADARIQDLYEKYDSYFLYRFSEEDLNWTMVSGALFETVYRHTDISPDRVCNLLDAVREAWLNFYTDDFNRRYLPKYVYLAETLESGSVSYNYADGLFMTKWSPIVSRHVGNQVAIANVDGDWATLDADKRKSFKNDVQSVVLSYYVSKKAITVPEEFYELSSYDGGGLTSSKARREGFIVNPVTGKDWATSAIQLTREEDVDAYLAGMAYYTASEWRKNVYSGYSVIQKKYEILLQALTDAGVDVNSMNSFR